MIRPAKFVSAYVAIRASGRFDATHYLAQLRRVGWRRYAPLFHYLWSGERRGRQPFAGFSPILHLAEHEDGIPKGMSPLHHFLRGSGLGANTGAVRDIARDVREAERAMRGITRRNRVAIHCHVFYYDLLDEIAAALAPIVKTADLIFTVTDKPGFDDTAQRMRGLWPASFIVRFPNHGRDILPFLTLVKTGKLDDYDAVCKIHTKKSVHRRDGTDWRRRLLGSLLDPARIEPVLARLREDRDCGLITADAAMIGGEERWEGTRQRAGELAARVGLDIDRYPLRFPAGSMYWLAPAAIRELRRLDLSAGDFEREEGQTDNTTAHAVERLVGLLLSARGLRALEVGDVSNAAPRSTRSVPVAEDDMRR